MKKNRLIRYKTRVFQCDRNEKLVFEQLTVTSGLTVKQMHKSSAGATSSVRSLNLTHKTASKRGCFHKLQPIDKLMIDLNLITRAATHASCSKRLN